MGIIIIKVLKRINSIIKKIIWKILYFTKIKFGKKTIFYPNCKITIDKKGKIIIGNYCFFNHGCSLNSLGIISIGDNCIFGENVKIYDHNHNYKNKELPFKSQGYNIGKVKIGNNCWIGSNVIILANVKIGDNVVVGAGSIITKDIESNSTVVDELHIRKISR